MSASEMTVRPIPIPPPDLLIDLIAASGYYSIVPIVLNYPLPAGGPPPLKALRRPGATSTRRPQ